MCSTFSESGAQAAAQRTAGPNAAASEWLPEEQAYSVLRRGPVAGSSQAVQLLGGVCKAPGMLLCILGQALAEAAQLGGRVAVELSHVHCVAGIPGNTVLHPAERPVLSQAAVLVQAVPAVWP